MTTWRTFAALELPQDIREALFAMQKKLAAAPGGKATRWTAPEQIHLTIKFYGEVEQSRIDNLAKVLSTCCAEITPFELSLAQLGCFPNTRQPRIIWAGLRDSDNQLSLLAEKIERASIALGLAAESRPFQPHLTLGRAKRDARNETLAALGASLQETRITQMGWVANSLTLYRSVLISSGPVYTILSQAPFAGKEKSIHAV